MMRSLQKLWRYARPARAAFLITSLFLCFRYFFINYLTAYLTGSIADAAQHMDVQSLLKGTARFAVLLLAFLALDTLVTYLSPVVIQRIGNDLRARAYEHILRAPLWQVEMLGTSRSQVLSRLNHDMSVVESIYRSSLLAPLVFGVAGVGAFISIWLVRRPIAVYLLLLGAVSFALQSSMSRQKKQVSARIQRLLASLLTAAGECLTYGPALRLMNAHSGMLAHAERRCRQYLNMGNRDAAIQSGAEMVTCGASMLQYVGVMAFSIFFLSRGQMEVAQVLYVLQLSGLVVSAFTMTGSALIALRGLLPAFDRVEEILTLEREALDAGLDACALPERQGIRADRAALCLSPETKLVIEGELHIPTGKISALCGASGCGKTSFVKTLIGFYPYEGTISLADRPLSAYAKRSLREQMAYLSQQNILVAGSIRENLRVGCRVPVTDAEIEEALRICACRDWLSEMEDGLDTRLEEGALRLSGGQRQMLAIARALLRKTNIIIMDETFSAIDKRRAVQIIQNIRRACPEKTILLISHEEEIVRCCDCRINIKSRRAAIS